MRWVDIPYQESNNQLLHQNISWPQVCTCCGGSDISKVYAFEAKIGKGANLKSEMFYPVSFSAPYCRACKKHAAIVGNAPYIYLAGTLLWGGLVYLISISVVDESYHVPLYFISGVLLGVGSYFLSKAITKIFSKNRVGPTCTTHTYAVRVFGYHHNIRIEFFNDKVAGEFARLNNLQMYMPVEETQNPAASV